MAALAFRGVVHLLAWKEVAVKRVGGVCFHSPKEPECESPVAVRPMLAACEPITRIVFASLSPWVCLCCRMAWAARRMGKLRARWR